MTNELTTFRFYARDGSIPPVSPSAVALICENAARLFEYTCGSVGLADSNARFEFAVAPRQGSLDIVLRHILDMAEPSGGLFNKEGWETAGNMAAVGGMIWVALFGGRGVVDLFRQSAKPDIDNHSEPNTDLRLRLTKRVLVDRNAQQLIRALLDTCILPGVSRVEIEVLDEPPVLLFGAEDRLQSRLLARGRRRSNYDAAAQGIKEVASKGGLVVDGTFNGKPVRIFLGSGAKGPRGIGSETFVILWASKADIPPVGGWVEVKAEAVSATALEGLKLHEAVPHEFEEAEGVLFVSSVSVWT